MAHSNAQVTQTFDTTLSDRVGGGQMRILTVPSRSFEGPVDPGRLEAELRALDIGHLSPIRSEFEVFDIFQRAVSDEYPLYSGDRFTQDPRSTRGSLGRFVETAIFTDVVPFEESPLDLTSISTLIKQATGVGLGAYVGFLVAGGPSPLLFITVPAGMVIMGTASGIAKALESGLNYRLLRLMGVPVQPSAPPSRRRKPRQ